MKKIAISVIAALHLWSCAGCDKQPAMSDGSDDQEHDSRGDQILDVLTDGDDDAEYMEVNEDFVYDVIEDDLLDDEFVLPDLPFCGNGVVDSGEECDDYNRLNGDGCDWLCRLGDGTPPPTDSDPTACTYEYSAGPIVFENAEADNLVFDPFPFAWTGSEYAVMYYQREANTLRFSRYTSGGVRLGTDYTNTSDEVHLNYDMVWTGSVFGLFYVDEAQGILFSEIDSDGGVLIDSLLVEPDPIAVQLAADVTEDGYVLVWLTDGPRPNATTLCTVDASHTGKLMRVGWGGDRSGYPDPVVFSDNAYGPPDVAVGERGIGIGVMDYRASTNLCYYRFYHFTRDLAYERGGGFLSHGYGYDVKWNGTQYSTTWTHHEAGIPINLCTAVFSPYGALERAPVCNDWGILPVRYGTKHISHCNGLSIMYAGRYIEDPPSINFHAIMRTDNSGVQVSASDDFSCCSFAAGGFNIIPIDGRAVSTLIATQDVSTWEKKVEMYLFLASE